MKIGCLLMCIRNNLLHLFQSFHLTIEINFIVHPNLVIVNVPVGPLLFTISTEMILYSKETSDYLLEIIYVFV